MVVKVFKVKNIRTQPYVSVVAVAVRLPRSSNRLKSALKVLPQFLMQCAFVNSNGNYFFFL